MKKNLLRIGVGLIIVLVLVVLAVSLSLDGIVKRAVETLGPKLTQVDVKLDRVSLSLLSGSGKITGLIVGNPKGFKTPQAISVGSASLSLKPGSLLSDKVVIKSINVQSPVITFEGGFGGNNLGRILANVKEVTGAGGESTSSKEAKPGKKLEVDDFVINGAKLQVSVTGMGGKSIPVTLPEIHLTDLGTGPDGITPGELTKEVLTKVEESAVKAADAAVANLGKNATGLSKELDKSAGENASKIGEKIGNLFKK